MLGELTPVAVDPRTADRDSWKRYHELRRLQQAEMDPDYPLEPDDVLEARMKRPDPFDERLYFEISREGVMLSWLEAKRTLPANPEHETNKHLFWAGAYVRKEQRRQGIATRWLSVVAREMERAGCTVLGASVERDPAHGFFKWLEAEPKLTEIESRLKLSDVDWEMMRRWVDEGAKRSPHTRLEIYDGPLPEGMLEDYAAQRSAMLNTMPFENLDIGQIIVTPARIHEYYARNAITGEIPHDVLTREPDGAFSGMTDVSWAPHRRTLIQQQFTGVRPDARGRGIGKWIKAAMVLHVRELYPDAEWIVTGNAGSNVPMLNINRGMGFKAHRTFVDYQITRDALEARIART